MANGELTTKQKLFVESYLAEPNGVQAARKAGYHGDDNVLAATASRLLRNVKISRLTKERVEQAIITADEILTDVKAIAKSADRDGDRLKAYEMLGKHLAMWIDKSESTADVTQKVVVEFIDDSE